MMSCRLCRGRTDEESSLVSLRTVDQDKFQKWASENTGSCLNLEVNYLACWSCVHTAKLMSEGSPQAADQDWWAGLVRPEGCPSSSEDEESDEDGRGNEDSPLLDLKSCSVQLFKLPDTFLVNKPCFVEKAKIDPIKSKPCLVQLTQIDPIQVEKKTDALRAKDYSCSICSKQFSEKSYLRRHILDFHDVTMMSCKFCPNMQFESKSFLDAHANYYHKEELQVAQLKLTCNYCGLLLPSHLKLKLHMNSQHADLRFDCSACPERFSTLFKLRAHKNCCHR